MSAVRGPPELSPVGFDFHELLIMRSVCCLRMQMADEKHGTRGIR